jgi:hypothetical protein
MPLHRGIKDPDPGTHSGGVAVLEAHQVGLIQPTRFVGVRVL